MYITAVVAGGGGVGIIEGRMVAMWRVVYRDKYSNRGVDTWWSTIYLFILINPLVAEIFFF